MTIKYLKTGFSEVQALNLLTKKKKKKANGRESS